MSIEQQALQRAYERLNDATVDQQSFQRGWEAKSVYDVARRRNTGAHPLTMLGFVLMLYGFGAAAMMAYAAYRYGVHHDRIYIIGVVGLLAGLLGIALTRSGNRRNQIKNKAFEREWRL
jgi:hypothetical protein